MLIKGIRRRIGALVAIGIAAVLSSTIVVPATAPSHAASAPAARAMANAADFQRGYLISDYAMYNGAAMTEAEIQAFLDARIGSCQNTLCLNVLRVNTVNKPADPMCDGYTGAAGESVARIIYRVQVSCDVSAKVILVTLEKEQSLVSATAPTEGRLRKAMGYACPDTSACDANYYGIFNQIYHGAWAFVRYTMPPGTGPGTEWYTNYNWFKIGANKILTHPDCGAVDVNIRNIATAALYFYTPYTPNDAALANLYGTGNGCSSYGNRNFWRLYTDWFGSPTTLVPSGVETTRLSGSDRYVTNTQVTRASHPDGADTVYVAVGSDYADALAAAPAAAQSGAPLVLTPGNFLPAFVKAEIERLAPQRIVVVGGTGVVLPAVYEQLAALAPEIRRDSGVDRYATARAIATTAFGEGGADRVFIATGQNFPDALSASAAAGALGAPVLLVRSSDTALAPELAQLITDLGATEAVIAGGTGAVKPAIQAALAALPGIETVTRLGGADRYATANAINAFAFADSDTAYVASGRDFPDALSAAAAAGGVGGPLLLSNGACTSTAALQQLVAHGTSSVYFVGGTGVLRSTVLEFMTCG